MKQKSEDLFAQRFTEYHCGVPVIKKAELPKAAAKLAKFENVVQDHQAFQEACDKLEEYICDKICLYAKACSTDAALQEQCDMCSYHHHILTLKTMYYDLNILEARESQQLREKIAGLQTELELSRHAVNHLREQVDKQNLRKLSDSSVTVEDLKKYAVVVQEQEPSAWKEMLHGAIGHAYYNGRIDRKQWESLITAYGLDTQ